MKKISIHLWIGFVFLLSYWLGFGLEDTFKSALVLGVLMVYFWITEPIPIYVTALLPIIIGTPMGVLRPSQIAESYGDKNVFLFLGGFVMALALEKWRVHSQIARSIVTSIGKSKPRILLGFLISTAFLSMWISNTATTLMMLPMVMAVVASMPPAEQDSKFVVYLILSIAYGSSIGGMATLVGSPPNVQMAGILQQNYNIDIDFMDWFAIGFPLVVILLLLIFIYFLIRMGKENRKQEATMVLEMLPWTTNQRRTLCLFGVVVFLWVMRKYIVQVTGINFGDETAALFGALLFFIVPSKEGSTKLLEWKDTEKLPWGILLLFGGGLALASCLETNGVIAEISQWMAGINHWNYLWILLIIVAIAIFGTELMSNLALVTVMVPVVATFAQGSGFSIVQLCLPLTLAASCAFMLPVGTPPNAIVFSSGRITIKQMARTGFLLNLIALGIIVLFAYFFIR